MSEMNGEGMQVDGSSREVSARGRVVRIRCRSKDEATGLMAALNNDEVIETLDVVGRQSLLSPRQRELAKVLAADEAL